MLSTIDLISIADIQVDANVEENFGVIADEAERVRSWIRSDWPGFCSVCKNDFLISVVSGLCLLALGEKFKLSEELEVILNALI